MLKTILRELLWLLGVIAVTLVFVAIVRRPWLGAFWVAPLPNTRGPVWINFNEAVIWNFMVFLGMFALSVLIRFTLHFIRNKRANKMVE